MMEAPTFSRYGIINICLTTMGGLGSKLYRVVTFLEALKL